MALETIDCRAHLHRLHRPESVSVEPGILNGGWSEEKHAAHVSQSAAAAEAWHVLISRYILILFYSFLVAISFG